MIETARLGVATALSSVQLPYQEMQFAINTIDGRICAGFSKNDPKVFSYPAR
jgi:hypothetical protein